MQGWDATMKIKGIFKAKDIVGYDINCSSPRRAKKRGLKTYTIDLEKNVPKGEMATISGVLHHIKNKEDVLRKVTTNFDYGVIREPIKSWWTFLDGGEPLSKEERIKLFDKVLENYTIFNFRVFSILGII